MSDHLVARCFEVRVSWQGAALMNKLTVIVRVAMKSLSNAHPCLRSIVARQHF
jgi:hypothetical protein